MPPIQLELLNSLKNKSPVFDHMANDDEEISMFPTTGKDTVDSQEP